MTIYFTCRIFFFTSFYILIPFFRFIVCCCLNVLSFHLFKFCLVFTIFPTWCLLILSFSALFPLSLSLSLCVCVCVCLCIHIYTCTQTHVYMCVFRGVISHSLIKMCSAFCGHYSLWRNRLLVLSSLQHLIQPLAPTSAQSQAPLCASFHNTPLTHRMVTKWMKAHRGFCFVFCNASLRRNYFSLSYFST